MRLKKNRSRVELNVYSNEKSKSQYTNFIDNDPNKLAQVLIDLIVHGFPVERAIKIMQERLRKGDWIGF